MTNFKTTKGALLLSIASLVLCFSMLLGTTFAWFTDSVSSSGNIIQTGTLDVAMSWAKSDEDPASAAWTDASAGAIFNNNKWEPGYVEAKHIKIQNLGSLALKYKLLIVPSGEVDAIADVIDVYFIPTATQLTNRLDLNDSYKVGTLRDLIEDNDGAVHGALLPAGETATNDYERVGEVTATIAFKMQDLAGNEYQDMSIGSNFSIQLFATQYMYEGDSFDNEYDSGAEYDEPITVSNAAELLLALESAAPGAVIDATGVETNMSELGEAAGAHTVWNVKAGATIKGLTLTTTVNQPILTSNGTEGSGEIVFEDCTFKTTSNFSDEVYFQSGTEASGTKLVFNNCNFEAAKVIFADSTGGGVELNNCKFNLNSAGYGLVQCMGGTHTFNACEFNISGSKSIGNSPITKYGRLNLYSEKYTTAVTLNQCINVPASHSYGGSNTLTNNP